MTQVMKDLKRKESILNHIEDENRATPIYHSIVIPTIIPKGYLITDNDLFRTSIYVNTHHIHLNCIGRDNHYAFYLAGAIEVTQLLSGFQFGYKDTSLQLSSKHTCIIDDIVGYENHMIDKKTYMDNIEIIVFCTKRKLIFQDGTELTCPYGECQWVSELDGTKSIIFLGQYTIFIHNIQEEVS